MKHMKLHEIHDFGAERKLRAPRLWKRACGAGLGIATYSLKTSCHEMSFRMTAASASAASGQRPWRICSGVVFSSSDKSRKAAAAPCA